VNPVGAGRGLVGRGREAGFDEARPVGGQAHTHTLDQHPVGVRLGYERDDLSGLRDIRLSRLIIRFMASKLLPFKSGRRAKITSSSALAVTERSSVDRSRAIIAFYLM
jgi:hypothetical protein